MPASSVWRMAGARNSPPPGLPPTHPEALLPDTALKGPTHVDAALQSQRQDETTCPSGIQNDPGASDTDSADGLFITQKPVPGAVRSVKRRYTRSNSNAPSPSDEKEGQDEKSLKNSKINKKKRRVKRKLRRYSFPSLKETKRNPDKRSSGGGKTSRGQRLTYQANTDFLNHAFGGFFKCVEAVKTYNTGGDSLATSLLVEEGTLSPLSEADESSDDEDIKVVERKLFATLSKPKTPWYTPDEPDRPQKSHGAYTQQGRQACDTVTEDQPGICHAANRQTRVSEDEHRITETSDPLLSFPDPISDDTKNIVASIGVEDGPQVPLNQEGPDSQHASTFLNSNIAEVKDKTPSMSEDAEALFKEEMKQREKLCRKDCVSKPGSVSLEEVSNLEEPNVRVAQFSVYSESCASPLENNVGEGQTERKQVAENGRGVDLACDAAAGLLDDEFEMQSKKMGWEKYKKEDVVGEGLVSLNPESTPVELEESRKDASTLQNMLSSFSENAEACWGTPDSAVNRTSEHEVQSSVPQLEDFMEPRKKRKKKQRSSFNNGSEDRREEEDEATISDTVQSCKKKEKKEKRRKTSVSCIPDEGTEDDATTSDTVQSFTKKEKKEKRRKTSVSCIPGEGTEDDATTSDTVQSFTKKEKKEKRRKTSVSCIPDEGTEDDATTSDTVQSFTKKEKKEKRRKTSVSCIPDEGTEDDATTSDTVQSFTKKEKKEKRRKTSVSCIPDEGTEDDATTSDTVQSFTKKEEKKRRRKTSVSCIPDERTKDEATTNDTVQSPKKKEKKKRRRKTSVCCIPDEGTKDEATTNDTVQSPKKKEEKKRRRKTSVCCIPDEGTENEATINDTVQSLKKKEEKNGRRKTSVCCIPDEGTENEATINDTVQSPKKKEKKKRRRKTSVCCIPDEGTDTSNTFEGTDKVQHIDESQKIAECSVGEHVEMVKRKKKRKKLTQVSAGDISEDMVTLSNYSASVREKEKRVAISFHADSTVEKVPETQCATSPLSMPLDILASSGGKCKTNEHVDALELGPEPVESVENTEEFAVSSDDLLSSKKRKKKRKSSSLEEGKVAEVGSETLNTKYLSSGPGEECAGGDNERPQTDETPALKKKRKAIEGGKPPAEKDHAESESSSLVDSSTVSYRAKGKKSSTSRRSERTSSHSVELPNGGGTSGQTVCEMDVSDVGKEQIKDRYGGHVGGEPSESVETEPYTKEKKKKKKKKKVKDMNMPSAVLNEAGEGQNEMMMVSVMLGAPTLPNGTDSELLGSSEQLKKKKKSKKHKSRP